jgi:3-oxoacyl-[acyl-carrier-protein] synthase-3
MGTIIKATGISTDNAIKSSNENAVAAGHQCIEAAGIDVNDIDLLINVGIYRDENMLEPAMAAFAQKGLGIKPDYIKSQPFNAAFSLDMMNSACGIINAIQTADAMFKSRQIKYALIVSGDAHPSNKDLESFPYATVGAAMLLEYAEDEKGFQNFSFKHSPTTEHSVRGYLDFNNLAEPAKERLTVDMPAQYKEKLLEFACDSAEEYLTANNLDRQTVKLITPQAEAGFGHKIAQSVNVKDDAILDLYKEYGDAHSSALTMAYHLGAEKGLYNSNDNVLFVAAGAGLTSACATYTV